MFGNLTGDNGRLDEYPFDSHGNTLMIFMSLISTLALDDIPDAQKWFDFCFRAYVNDPSPWSGPEGGYANGTAYAEYAGGYMVALWDAITQASGVNMYAKPWSLGFLDFSMMLTPPGAKVHAFGDGSETKPDQRVFRAFALRMVNPRANWYAANLSGIEDGLSVLEAPYPMPIVGNAVKTPPSNEAYYPSIGWVAIHSDIGDTNRTSFFFKSSPYGSFNHSHGDQNGFLLSVAGQPLLVKAGWYDWYGSPYWTDWYHHRLLGQRRLRLCRRRRHPGLWRPADDGQAPDLVPEVPERGPGARQAVGRGPAHLRVQHPRPGGDDGGEPVEREDRGGRPVGLPARPERQRAVRDLDRTRQAQRGREPWRLLPEERRQVGGRVPGPAGRRLQAPGGQGDRYRQRPHGHGRQPERHPELITELIVL
jgi:hypothetical protein